MKKWFLSGLFVANALVVEAAVFTHTAQIYQLNAKDSVIQGADTSFVELKQFSSDGTCKIGLGVVRAIIRDDYAGDRQYSLLLSAAVSNNEVMVKVDDNFKNSEGYCYLLNVRYQF